jgi:hypothetical protein
MMARTECRIDIVATCNISEADDICVALAHADD